MYPKSFSTMFPCIAGLVAASGLAERAVAQPDPRPNVVLVVFDDLNDYVTGYPGAHPQARTPHLERLTQEGITFTRAYSNQPICAPSRASFLSGLYPHTSGHLFFEDWRGNPVLDNTKWITEYFRENGYHVAGTGKIFHHRNRRGGWTEFANEPDYGPYVWEDGKRVGHPAMPDPFRSPTVGSMAPLSSPTELPGAGPYEWRYGYPWDNPPVFDYIDEDNRDLTPDEMNAQWAVKQLEAFAARDDMPPFFLAVGIIRPHTPLYAPPSYFDLFPLEEVQLPEFSDAWRGASYLHEIMPPTFAGFRNFNNLAAAYDPVEDGLRLYLQAYLACITFADAQAGAILDALDASPFQDNTIVLVTSDHGFHVGERDFIGKHSPWERSARVPFIMRAPNVSVPGSQVNVPIGLIDIYPTLKDLCGLEGDTRRNEKGRPLDGFSLRPLLENPAAGQWDGPEGALTMIFGGPDSRPHPELQHWSLRTADWRYIWYSTGQTELYDHRTGSDPMEWYNVSDDPAHAETKAHLHALVEEMVGVTLNRD